MVVVAFVRVALACLFLLVGAVSAPAAASAAHPLPVIQLPGNRLDEAAAFAEHLSRLEADRDWAALAALMHPDSRAVVPVAAVTGWYADTFANTTTSALSVTAVEPISWVWPVTGASYDAVRVSFTQPYWVDGVRRDETGVVHLAESAEGGWGWFFGASRPFVDEQISRYAAAEPSGDPAVGGQVAAGDGEADRAARFPDPLHAHVDAFWAERFAAVGVAYQPPGGVVGFDGPIPTGCGIADPREETAFYCVLDSTIYYSTEFRRVIEENIGDFGWVVVVAHEWGHHVQLLLGYDAGVLSWTVSRAPSVAMEQQADCLAGAYTERAEATGWLDPGDVGEAVLITGLSGDPAGTAAGDPEAHGSGPERVAAFNAGYVQGLSACGLEGAFAGG